MEFFRLRFTAVTALLVYMLFIGFTGTEGVTCYMRTCGSAGCGHWSECRGKVCFFAHTTINNVAYAYHGCQPDACPDVWTLNGIYRVTPECCWSGFCNRSTNLTPLRFDVTAAVALFVLNVVWLF
ncbi:uncharacterized protein LOC141911371 [Tubulanus polymorphus]|uniref:uncharacterized protein LOC141911371 n=1 Tax=Tubulanus polymorphus TaxID=672921 RepID=UPI003DA5CB6E